MTDTNGTSSSIPLIPLPFLAEQGPLDAQTHFKALLDYMRTVVRPQVITAQGCGDQEIMRVAEAQLEQVDHLLARGYHLLKEDMPEGLNPRLAEAEGLLLYDELVALATSKAERSAFDADMILQIVFLKLAEKFMLDGFRPSELAEMIFQVGALIKPNQ